MKVSPEGRLELFAEVQGPVGLLIGKSGDFYAGQARLGKVVRIKADGTRIVVIEGLQGTEEPAFDRAGNLFVPDAGAGRILKLTGDF